jgi:hypothetical protein
MANLGGTFDATQVAPNTAIEILPPGDYRVQIVRSEMKATKNGDGQYLELEMDVLDGEHANRKIWDRLNLVNANEQAAQIAQRTLSAICHAVGVLHVSDSEQLHMRPMVAVVKVEPRRDRPGEVSNRINGYKSLSGATAAPAPTPFQRPPAAAAPQPASTATAAPPWKRSA